MLYLSRKIGWSLAIIFFIIAMGMYFWPDSTRPIIGYAVSMTDSMVRNFLDLIKYLLS